MLALLNVLAADSPVDPDVIAVSALWVTIAAAVIPVITSLLTRYDAHPFVKTVISVILSAVSSILQTATLADGVAVFSKQMAVLTLFQALATLVTYNSVYRPVNLNAKLAPGAGLRLGRDPDVTFDGTKFTNRRSNLVVPVRRAR
jgi:hypothetical protein